MTTFRLIFRSLLHYWRTNLAVLLGVIAGTAVIGGALIVGDSVRYSLRKMTYDRLGDVDHVLTGPRFFREELADEVAAEPGFQQRYSTAAPALVLTGGFQHDLPDTDAVPGDRQSRRVGNVNVYGVDDRMWNLTDHGGVAPPADDEIILNRRTADGLNVEVGRKVTLTIELPATIPRDSLLGSRDQSTVRFDLTVRDILEDDVGVSRLNLSPNQQSPLNAFVSLSTLQQRLGLNERRIRDRVRRRIIIKPARVNTIFFSAKDPADGDGDAATDAAESLTTLVDGQLSLNDLYLRIAKHRAGQPKFEYLALESEQQVLATEFSNAGKNAAEKLGLSTSPVLVYLANEISDVAGEKFSRYSVVAGVDVDRLQNPPFGPFEFRDRRSKVGDQKSEAKNEVQRANNKSRNTILLNEWLAEDLDARVGDEVRLTYHVVGAHILAEDGRLPEEEVRFTVTGIVKLDGSVADDRGFTPEVEGITDVDSFDEWKKPFPMKDVTDRDDDYWTKHRATPKAFVPLETAQNLWQSRYGKLTSVRVARLPGKSLDETQAAFAAAVLDELGPRQSQLIVRPVKFEGLQAASGTTDFTGLFIAFSFFLILAAAILIGLLFRLGIEQRSSSVGLLGAVGCTPKQVHRLFLAEGLCVVVVGGLIGCAAARGYAGLMVYGLKTWWIGAIGTRFLFVSATPTSYIAGFAGSVAVAMFAVWWALRYFRRFSARDLLAGATEPPQTQEGIRRRGNRSRTLAAVCGGFAAVLLTAALTGLIPDAEAFEGFSWQVVAFFLVGVSLLATSLASLAWLLNTDKSAAVAGRGLSGAARLGMRNAARHRQRSVMTVALIASATFVIVAVAAGRRNPAVERPDKSTGNGGFTLVARSSAPLLHNLNSPSGRREMQLDFTQQIQQATNRAERADRQSRDAETPDERQRLEDVAQENRGLAERLQRQRDLMQEMTAVSFRVKPGEDASCLNIYQTRVPTILAAPPEMIERGGFKFVGSRRENPWTLLTEELEPQDGKPVYPVLGDMNTLRYSLKKGVGQTIAIPDEDAPDYYLQVVGMFDGSVFQGVLLISEPNFQHLYPERSGYEFFLIDVPYDEQDPAQWRRDARELQTTLESGLDEFGFDSERVADRIADFLAVQNTYLSTFQTLGGLGLLLGSLGLATVMLRNVLERRAEFALLRAVGFRNALLSWLVVVENALLLVWGLLSGAAAALLAMSPHLTSTGADVPWQAVGWILAGVFGIGMIAALAAVWEAVRTPIVATLRSE